MAVATDTPVPGQRWVSDTEPEMGLGIILKCQFGRVEIFFPAADEHRQYALRSAPLRRVRFEIGDRILTHDGAEVVVESVGEDNGMLTYRGKGHTVTEAELSDSISFSKPEDRLAGGQIDDLHTFDLRVESLHRRCAMRKSPVRGFVGGRVDMIPHQMFIAGEVSKRLVPRVLLADEVGLGKTIEAGLILHRLHLTGRAERVLILLPEPLIHQWFVEFLRRFNLLFSLFDEERCESIEANDPDANPFLDSQLVICGLDFLAGNPGRAAQALEASWDMVIVDEAHHLEWHPETPSIQYRLVEQLAKRSPGLLLLTATPQQLGPEGHFARLRLLDPDRYAALDMFLAEAGHYEEVASAVDRLLSGKPLTPADAALFGEKSAGVARHCAALAAGEESARDSLVGELLDEFGTGRVLFRNTRAALTGFPERKALLVPLAAGDDLDEAKIKWLARFLRKLGSEKVLTICRTRKLAEEIQERLQQEITVKSALFHEGLTLLQRDRNAAYFAEEDGARVLICSEIGSEGRNFQFAHHLVLFDLPEDPELLEQRIGRLDRIGQTAEIAIHVPHGKGTESEVLARWYHEGLNAFERSLHGATEIAQSFAGRLAKLREKPNPVALRKLIAESRVRRDAVAEKLGKGHDRLLELSSCKPEEAASTIACVRESDADVAFEEFLIRLLDHFGLHVEELGSRSYLLRPGNLLTDAFPSLPEGGLSVTFDRTRALSRDDMGFMSFDHPIVRSAIDLLLGSESGNAAFGIWKTPGSEALLLEVYAVAECVAPVALHVDRFLPATPIRVVVDHRLRDRSSDPAVAAGELQKGNVYTILDKATVKRDLLPAMLAATRKLAGVAMLEMVKDAVASMETQLGSEIGRMEDLRAINDHVRPDEIEALNVQKTALGEALRGARLRLDAVRMIWRKQ